MKSIKNTSPWILLRTTFDEWNADRASRLSAALAFYSIFSMAPLLVLAVGLAGIFFGREFAQAELAGQVEQLLGSADAAAFVEDTIGNAAVSRDSWITTIVGIGFLFWGASGIFWELKSSLNLVWKVPRRPANIRRTLLSRLVTLFMVLMTQILLLLSLIVNTVLTVATQFIDSVWWPGLASWTQLISFVVFFFITLLVIVLIYKYVPDIRLAWGDVWAGAFATALLFSIGRLVISFYLAFSGIGSVWGVAGSLAVILIWVFYSAQIFFLGAEFTQVYARSYGSHRHDRTAATAPAPLAAETVTEPELLNPAMPAPERTGWRASLDAVATFAVATSIMAVLSIFNMLTWSRRDQANALLASTPKNPGAPDRAKWLPEHKPRDL
jgi:membrane protein